jgi:hypothetical protein
MRSPASGPLAPALPTTGQLARARAGPLGSRPARGSGLALLLLAGGCSMRAYSPPAGWSRASQVATAPQGETWLGASGHGGGGLFGPDLVGGALSLRRGLSETLELEADAGWVQIDAAPRTPVFRGVLTGRGGLRGRFAPDLPHLAWSASLGGGAHAAGGFLSPEAGLQAGYANRWLTPWVQASGFVSLPLGARAVDVAPAGAEAPTLDAPVTTVGLRLGAGLAIGWDDLPLRLHLAAHVVHLARLDGPSDSVSHVGLGLEYGLVRSRGPSSSRP